MLGLDSRKSSLDAVRLISVARFHVHFGSWFKHQLEADNSARLLKVSQGMVYSVIFMN